MAIIGLPYTWADAVVITAANLNIINTTIYNEFNGNIDNTNIKSGANIDAAKLLNASILAGKIADGAITDAKIDYTSVKVLRTGAVGLKLARGTKAFTLVAGEKTFTITFSTDTTDAVNPAFSTTPDITITVLVAAGGTTTYTAKITARSAASFSTEVISSNGADVSSLNLCWIAVGT